ncbi:MAG: hypothetical protein HRU12_02775 [Phaeodactylibacter sp.]|nr:hypothetical protein [Phaeodactylibacter sp.]
MGLLRLDGIAKSLEKLSGNVAGIFKATDKGVLSSRRTISGLIVAFALYDMETKGINELNLIVLGLGIVPVGLLTFVKSSNLDSNGKEKN